MIPDNEIIIEYELLLLEDEELMRRVMFDELPEDLADKKDYSE